MKQATPDYLGRLRRHQRRMTEKWEEATYYEQTGYKEFRELAAKCWEEFARFEVIEAMLLAEVRREQAEREIAR